MDEAVKLAGKGARITPAQVDALEKFASIAHSMCECEEHHHDMRKDGYHHDGQCYVSRAAESAAYVPHGGGEIEKDTRRGVMTV